MSEQEEKKNPDKITVFAQTTYRSKSILFGIKPDDRRRHMYVIGKTGMGKTTLLKSMIYSDIMNGHGLAVVDPHGDLAEEILEYIPDHRVNDVIYFAPSDLNFPIAFNVLEKVDKAYQHLVASGLVGVFKKIWADSWGPRLEYVLRNTILALLDFPDSTILGIMRLLVDKAWRKKVIEKISDPVVKSFWVDEYSKYPDKFQQEAIAPIQNKVGQFLSSSVIRNIVGQVKSTINMREIMDEGKILIMNLSKGRIGEDNSSLLGAMMITKMQLAVMGRVDVPEEQRRDFYLYVDEFQNFATESFATILSEARKYRLDLTIAHQYIEQLDEKVAAAVFGNVGTLITFRIGATDAEFLEKEFEPRFTKDDLQNLPKYYMYLKLMIDGITSEPFSAQTLTPHFKKYGNVEKIIKVSRERYAKSREVVEDKIRRWTEVDQKESMASTATEKSDKPRYDSNKEMFPVHCWVCGKEEKIPFKPDETRPIYCAEHLEKVRKGTLTAEEKDAVKRRRKEVGRAMDRKKQDERKSDPKLTPQPGNRPRIVKRTEKEDNKPDQKEEKEIKNLSTVLTEPRKEPKKPVVKAMPAKSGKVENGKVLKPGKPVNLE